MGEVRLGPPTELILELQSHFGLDTFVETGTFRGDTALWASRHFSRVVTVEAAEHIYQAAQRRLGSVPNVELLHGDSRRVLPQVLPTITGAAVFWLDSHWSGGETFGAQDECPLLAEVRLLNASSPTHFLLIDDARMFLSPPPEPHREEHWPSIDRVLAGLQDGTDRYVVIFEDVIIAVPSRARAVVAEYCRRKSTHAWRARRRAPGSTWVSRALWGVVRRAAALRHSVLRNVVP
jgi:hypothetical protein